MQPSALDPTLPPSRLASQEPAGASNILPISTPSTRQGSEPCQGERQDAQEAQLPLLTASEKRHKARFDFWLGIYDDPLSHWPGVSSECNLDIQEINGLLFDFFPAQHPTSVELLNVYRFVVTCRTTESTWKPTLPASTHAKLAQLVQLVCWTEFRECFNASILLPFFSCWQTQRLIPCTAKSSSKSVASSSSNAAGSSSANKRLASGKRKQGSIDAPGVHPHFCVGAPSALATSAIRHPVVPRTVRSSACLVTYMSRMYEPPRGDRYEHMLRDESKRHIYYIRVYDFSLIRPCKLAVLLDLIRQHGCVESSTDDGEASSEVAGSFGLFRDDFDGSSDMRQGVRASILSCLRLWNLDEQGSHLDPQRLDRLARLLISCTCSPHLDIKALRSLATWLHRFLERFKLLAHKEYAGKQPGSGFSALAGHLVGQNTGERKVLWLEIAKSILAVLAGEHAQLLLFHLVHHLEQHSSNATVASILAQVDQPPIDTDSSLVQQHTDKVERLVHALRECNASYLHIFQGQLVRCDLNQSLLEKLDHIRLGFDTAPVAREAKGRKAKPRRQRPSPVESVSSLGDLSTDHQGLADCSLFTGSADLAEDEDDLHLDHAASSPPRRRRRTDIGPSSQPSCALSPVEEAPVVVDDDVAPLLADASAGPDWQALVASPGVGRDVGAIVGARRRNFWHGLPPYSPETTWSESESSMSAASLLVINGAFVAHGTQQRLSASLDPNTIDAAVDTRRSSSSTLAMVTRSSRGGRRESSPYCRILQDPWLKPELQQGDNASGQEEAGGQQGEEQVYSIVGSDMILCSPSHSNIEVHGEAIASSSSMSRVDLVSQTVFATPEQHTRSFAFPNTSLGLPRAMHADALSTPTSNAGANLVIPSRVSSVAETGSPMSNNNILELSDELGSRSTTPDSAKECARDGRLKTQELVRSQGSRTMTWFVFALGVAVALLAKLWYLGSISASTCADPLTASAGIDNISCQVSAPAATSNKTRPLSHDDVTSISTPPTLNLPDGHQPQEEEEKEEDKVLERISMAEYAELMRIGRPQLSSMSCSSLGQRASEGGAASPESVCRISIALVQMIRLAQMGGGELHHSFG
ncbi:uncharacterized protein UBRO2_04317 [Ustilago bromivora]|uniref:Uncharacterized protein n=1 Tax=Ustilago bromivora TaxID=307758 RepID=A0A8H8QPD5_9BASI|nr:uncharacterized protein UBRO2_04317 [Ustilago bromivora]